jgi:hypothetical protein
MRETLFSEDFLTLDYLHEFNMFMTTWSGYVDFESCVAGHTRIKESVKRTQFNTLLSDMSKVQSITKDVQTFLLEEQHYQLANLGLRFHAIILPTQWLGKTPERVFIPSANDSKRLEVVFFDSARMAGLWLKMKI